MNFGQDFELIQILEGWNTLDWKLENNKGIKFEIGRLGQIQQ
jgi:hypothetical protein